MFKKSIKSFVAAAIIASGAAVASTGSANAGNSFGAFVGSDHSNVIQINHVKRRSHGHKRFHGKKVFKRKHHRRAACGPRRALNKAYRIGVNRPHVARINHKRIVVLGYNRGHPAKVVFKRSRHGCKIIKARGL